MRGRESLILLLAVVVVAASPAAAQFPGPSETVNVTLDQNGNGAVCFQNNNFCVALDTECTGAFEIVLHKTTVNACNNVLQGHFISGTCPQLVGFPSNRRVITTINPGDPAPVCSPGSSLLIRFDFTPTDPIFHPSVADCEDDLSVCHEAGLGTGSEFINLVSYVPGGGGGGGGDDPVVVDKLTKSHIILVDKTVTGSANFTGLPPLTWTNSPLTVNQGRDVSVKFCLDPQFDTNPCVSPVTSGAACMISLAQVLAGGQLEPIINVPGSAPSGDPASPFFGESPAGSGQYNFNLDTDALSGLFKISVLCNVLEPTPATFLNVVP